ncbi:MAG: YncE family protein [Kofleriaceae bacterium]|nr:YncE family protein [Kofleriaceae bacterium]
MMRKSQLPVEANRHFSDETHQLPREQAGKRSASFHSALLCPALCLIGVMALAACPATSDEVRPAADRFFFPTGLAMLGDGTALFVLNANSDLRFDSGSINVVDLDRVEEIADQWVASGAVPSDVDCDIDSSVAYTMVCNEKEFILANSTVRTGNFATEIGVQELDDGSSRIFAAVRGDPSLTWADFDPGSRTLSCGGSGAVPRCDEAHRLSRMRNDDSIGSMAVEPFGLYVDSVGGFVVLTHLVQGAVTLADAPLDGSPPILSDVLGGVFRPDNVSNVSSALGASARVPGGQVYVTSRSEERVQTFTVGRIPGEFPALVPGDYFFLRGVSPSDNGRGIRFSPSGDRAYVVNRSPAVLQVLDTSLNEGGSPRNELVRTVELCSSASGLVVGDLGQGDRAYVSCFRQGQVWVVDPGLGSVDAIIDVGRGPQGLVLSELNNKLYVSNFLEDTVAVVDLESGSATENRVVLKLGRTRQSGGN